MLIETFGSPIRLGHPLTMQDFELDFNYDHYYLTPYALLKVDASTTARVNKPFMRFDIDPQADLGVSRANSWLQSEEENYKFQPKTANLYSPSLHTVST